MSERTTNKSPNNQKTRKEVLMKRLSKRLMYVLRYGALKEGLDVDANGYVDVEGVLQVPLLSEYSQDEIMNEVKTSISYRNIHRYEWKEKDKRTLIRSSYLRRFEASPFHPGTQVKTLIETSMMCILDNLDMFDLEDFQDEHTIKLMIRRLKRKKAVTNKALSVLLVPTITRIDLEGIYLTNNTIRMLWTQCPHLRGISLRNCGYIITDTVLTRLVKNLPLLEQLNLCRCAHLTDNCLAIMSKRLTHLKVLHIAGVPLIKPKAVSNFLDTAKELTFLDVFYMNTTQDEFDSLMKKAECVGVKLVLHSPKMKLPVKKQSPSLSEEDEENYDDDDGDDDEGNDDDEGDDDDESSYSDGIDEQDESDGEFAW